MTVRETGTPEVAGEIRHTIGEGPVWDPIRRRAMWVDIPEGQVFVGEVLEDGRIRVERVLQSPDTAGAATVDAAGRVLIAGRDRLWVRDVDGKVSPGPVVLRHAKGRRLNDGKADPAGRFLVGSLREQDDSTEELLVRLEGQSVEVIDEDLGLSNGLAWSVDGSRFYSVDSARQRIYVRSYQPQTGGYGERHIFAELDEGLPDGICVDEEDHLWAAVYGPGEVRRYSPEGELVATVDVPAPHTTSVGFVGDDLDVLLITTASAGLTEDELRRSPLSGRIFTYRPGVRGPRPYLWAGDL